MLGNDVVDLLDVDARPETYRPRFDQRVFSALERRAIERDPNPQARRWAHWAAKEAAYKLARQVDPDFVFSPVNLVARFEAATETVAGSPESAARGEEASDSPLALERVSERHGALSLPDSIARGPRELELRSFESAEHVHVMALPRGGDWEAVVSAVEVLGTIPEPGSGPGSGSREALHALAESNRGDDAGPTAVSTARSDSVEPSDPPDAAGADDTSDTNDTNDASAAVRALAVRRIARDLGIEEDRVTVGRRGKIPTVSIDGARSTMSISLSHHGRFVACAMQVRSDVTTAGDPEETSEPGRRPSWGVTSKVGGVAG